MVVKTEWPFEHRGRRRGGCGRCAQPHEDAEADDVRGAGGVQGQIAVVLGAGVEDARGQVGALVAEILVVHALLDVVGLAREDQQGLVLGLPPEPGDGAVVAVGVERPPGCPGPPWRLRWRRGWPGGSRSGVTSTSPSPKVGVGMRKMMSPAGWGPSAGGCSGRGCCRRWTAGRGTGAAVLVEGRAQPGAVFTGDATGDRVDLAEYAQGRHEGGLLRRVEPGEGPPGPCARFTPSTRPGPAGSARRTRSSAPARPPPRGRW